MTPFPACRAIRRFRPALLWATLCLLGGCANSLPQASVAPFPGGAQDQSFSQIYRLGAGDRLRITVYGEEDLSGEYLVGSEGAISMPLIGKVSAANLTLAELQEAVSGYLCNGYIREPRVSVEVVNYRPFYIYGEVKNAGEFPYQAGISVMNAVAMAGGYTYRANARQVFITHKGANGELKYPANQATMVMPGDIIRIPQRFF